MTSWALRLSALLALAPLPLAHVGPVQAGGDAERGPRDVAIFVYPGVELLDFAGPGEVFAAAHGESGRAFRVFTVAASAEPIVSQGFVTVTPAYTFDNCPELDILVLPGGGVPVSDEGVIEWVEARNAETEVTLSVCNGALLLAKAGLLKGREVTTHHGALQYLAMMAGDATVLENRRFVDSGDIVTSAGVSAGIDGALHVVERLVGAEAAARTARYMEYDWRPDEIRELHAQVGRPVERNGMFAFLDELRGGKKPQAETPPEAELNSFGYELLNAGRVEDAALILAHNVIAYPESANVYDSLADAREAQGKHADAVRLTQEALQRLERDDSIDDERRAAIAVSARGRLERLAPESNGSGDGDAAKSNTLYVCPPCSVDCHHKKFTEPGYCPNTACNMRLIVYTPPADGNSD